jgi:hypothetical protein
MRARASRAQKKDLTTNHTNRTNAFVFFVRFVVKSLGAYDDREQRRGPLIRRLRRHLLPRREKAAPIRPKLART